MIQVDASQSTDCKVVLRGLAVNADADGFRAQVAEFLSGVVDHKGAPFFKHLKREHFAISILPGRIIDDFDEYVRFQEGWNTRTDARWSYSFEEIYLYNRTQGFVVILAVYEDHGTDGTRFRRTIRIKDNFLLDGGTWYLTENQNTVLSETKPHTAKKNSNEEKEAAIN